MCPCSSCFETIIINSIITITIISSMSIIIFMFQQFGLTIHNICCPTYSFIPLLNITIIIVVVVLVVFVVSSTTTWNRPTIIQSFFVFILKCIHKFFVIKDAITYLIKYCRITTTSRRRSQFTTTATGSIIIGHCVFVVVDTFDIIIVNNVKIITGILIFIFNG